MPCGTQLWGWTQQSHLYIHLLFVECVGYMQCSLQDFRQLLKSFQGGKVTFIEPLCMHVNSSFLRTSFSIDACMSRLHYCSTYSLEEKMR